MGVSPSGGGGGSAGSSGGGGGLPCSTGGWFSPAPPHAGSAEAVRVMTTARAKVRGLSDMRARVVRGATDVKPDAARQSGPDPARGCPCYGPIRAVERTSPGGQAASQSRRTARHRGKCTHLRKLRSARTPRQSSMRRSRAACRRQPHTRLPPNTAGQNRNTGRAAAAVAAARQNTYRTAHCTHNKRHRRGRHTRPSIWMAPCNPCCSNTPRWEAALCSFRGRMSPGPHWWRGSLSPPCSSPASPRTGRVCRRPDSQRRRDRPTPRHSLGPQRNPFRSSMSRWSAVLCTRRRCTAAAVRR